jgi:hypothetical protein
MMTLIITMLLYVFGLNPTTGMLNTSPRTPTTNNAAGNIMYYDSQNHPYVIIPKPTTNGTSLANSSPSLSNNPPTYNAWNSSNPALKF